MYNTYLSNISMVNACSICGLVGHRVPCYQCRNGHNIQLLPLTANSVQTLDGYTQEVFRRYTYSQICSFYKQIDVEIIRKYYIMYLRQITPGTLCPTTTDYDDSALAAWELAKIAAFKNVYGVMSDDKLNKAIEVATAAKPQGATLLRIEVELNNVTNVSHWDTIEKMLFG